MIVWGLPCESRTLPGFNTHPVEAALRGFLLSVGAMANCETAGMDVYNSDMNPKQALVKETLLRILADGKFYSGEELGQMLGISRSAVWKHIQSLLAYQLDIHAVPGKGYRLAAPIELLDRDEILQYMQPLGRVSEIDVLFVTDSTNRYLLDKSKQITDTHFVCLAEYQKSGRGRRGRQWISPLGANLYGSILWRSSMPLHALSCIGLVVGVALSKALSSLGLKGHQLKWPNDLYWQDKKMGGILVETLGELSGPSLMVIGVGLNVNMSDSANLGIDQPWVDLNTALGRPISRNKLVALFLHELFVSLDMYEEHGFDAFIEQWREFDLLKGKKIRILIGEESVIGMAVGVDASGALLVKHNNTGKTKRYFSGEVSVRYDV